VIPPAALDADARVSDLGAFLFAKLAAVVFMRSTSGGHGSVRVISRTEELQDSAPPAQ
jgi:hypothetical protein